MSLRLWFREPVANLLNALEQARQVDERLISHKANELIQGPMHIGIDEPTENIVARRSNAAFAVSETPSPE